MNDLQVFNNNDFTVRTVQEDNGEIWFVAKDIAQALDYSTDGGMTKYFNHVPEVWKGGKRISTTSEKPTARPYQDVLCLTEQGLYFFLGRSDKPKAYVDCWRGSTFNP